MEREDDETFVLPTAEEGEVEEKARISIAKPPVKDRVGSFIEVVSGYSPDEAIEEAGRCLRCDLEIGGE